MKVERANSGNCEFQERPFAGGQSTDKGLACVTGHAYEGALKPTKARYTLTEVGAPTKVNTFTAAGGGEGWVMGLGKGVDLCTKHARSVASERLAKKVMAKDLKAMVASGEGDVGKLDTNKGADKDSDGVLVGVKALGAEDAKLYRDVLTKIKGQPVADYYNMVDRMMDMESSSARKIGVGSIAEDVRPGYVKQYDADKDGDKSGGKDYSNLAPAAAEASKPKRGRGGGRRNPNAGMRQGGAGTPSVTIKKR